MNKLIYAGLALLPLAVMLWFVAKWQLACVPFCPMTLVRAGLGYGTLATGGIGLVLIGVGFAGKLLENQRG